MAYKNPQPMLCDDTSTLNEASHSTQEKVASYTLHRNTYFAFIDVLGFKQEFSNRGADTSSFAQKFADTFIYFSKLMHTGFLAREDCHSGQTSDSLYFFTEVPTYLSHFIKIYTHFCLFAMSNNVFLRGGIAKGNLFYDDPSRFYGDCVIKAYLLENDIAQFPRVMLDTATYEDIKKMPGMESLLQQSISDSSPRHWIKPFYYLPSEELISLLGGSPIDVYEIGEVEKRKIQDIITARLSEYEFDDSVFRKYAFLKNELQTIC